MCIRDSSIDYVKNYGAAFNILNGNRIFLSTLSTIITLFLIYFILYKKNLSNSFYRLFLKMLYSKIMNPILIDISAILNTGKSIKFKLIKSIT